MVGLTRQASRDHFGGVVPTAPQEAPPGDREPREKSVLRSYTQPLPDREPASPRGSVKKRTSAKLSPRGHGSASASISSRRSVTDAFRMSVEAFAKPREAPAASAAEAARQQEKAPSLDPSDKKGCEFKKVVLAKRFVHKVKARRNDAAESSGVYTGCTDERMMVEQELVKSPMLRNCSPSFVEELARSTKFRKLQAGLVPNPEASLLALKFLLVLRGRVLVFITDRPVARLCAGKHFGEAVLLGLEENPRVEFSAEVNSTIAEISREDFQEVLKEFEAERRWFSNIYKRNSSSTCQLLGTFQQPCQLFSGLAQEVIRHMDMFMLRRLYFPGERIVQEGQDCAELLALVWGKAGVEIAGRFVRYESTGMPSEEGEALQHVGVSPPEQPPPSFRPRRISRNEAGTGSDLTEKLPVPCFGELGLLGLQQKHYASVVAKTVCHFRVLQRSLYQHVLREHSASPPGLELLSSLSLLPRSPLTDIATFKEASCHPQFLDFLESHLEMRIYAPRQKIQEEGEQQERCLYMLVRGAATAMKGKREVGHLSAGDAFGAILGIPLPTWANACVLAKETCYVRILHQGVIMRGLELFPDDRKNLLLKAQPRRMSVNANGVPSSPAPMPRRISIVDTTEQGATEVSPNADAIAAAELAKLRDPGMRGAIMQVLRRSSFFADVSEEFVDEIASTSVDRIYMPGDRIIEEGQRGDSMFVMISGTAAIYVADPEICVDPHTKSQAMADTGGLCTVAAKTRVATLNPGGISGELAMLGVSPFRGATIQAETICSMWEISQDDGITFLERFPESRLHFRQVIVQHLERTVMARIIHLPLLQGFSRKFLTLVGLYCEREAYFPGDVIVREGQTGLKMYIINIGTARLFLKGVTVKTYGAGGIYGTSVMLGINKSYFGSLVALQTCHVVRIPRSSYQHALEQYPSKLAAKKLRKTEESAEEEFRGAMQRVSTRKLVWNRYQGSLHYTVGNLTQQELLTKTLDSWKNYLRHARETRTRKQSELERCTKVIREYVEKKREQLWRAQELAQAREEGAWPSSPSRCHYRSEGEGTASPTDLPAIGRGRTTPGEELAKIVSEWAMPKPSPFYQLRVHNVLAKVIERPTIAGPLLPLLQAGGPRRSPAAIAEESENEVSSSDPQSPRSVGGGEPNESRVRLPRI